MKKLMLVIGLLLMTSLLFASCASPATSGSDRSEAEFAIEESMSAPAPGIATSDFSQAGGGEALAPLAEERMIVRNGDMSLIVEDVLQARDEIAQLASRLDGFVVSSRVSGEGGDMRGNISIRVPDENFEPALADLRQLAVRVDSESTSSRDVTEEYIDLEARLKNAEATESQYLALLDRADDVEDILRIYDSLSRVRQEIEQIKGRLQYLERTSSTSLISVQLRPETSEKPVVPVGWSALEALKSALRGTIGFGQVLFTVIIWIAILSPLWGAALGIIYWRRRRQKQKS
jgi:predicted small secreted protein